MMDIVTLEHVRKVFRSQTVLHDITLAIRQREFLVIVGPSGCGKSTLLRLVAGLETLSGGHIYFEGHLADSWSPYTRNVGMVFQNYALYPHLTVYDNLAFGLVARKTDKAEVRRRVEEAAHLLELQTVLTAKPGALSGGQRQRVALGRALVRQPRLFLMDEPLSNLDALLRERMRIELRALYERVGISTMYVTHDQTEAMTMADRMVVMNAGQILQVGTPDDVYHRPATRFVGQFFGSPAMNVVPIVAVHRAGTYLVHPEEDPSHPIPVPSTMVPALLEAATDTGRLWMGFRAEVVRVSEGPSGLKIGFATDTAEALGPRHHVHGRWAGHPVSVVAESATSFRRHQNIAMTVPWAHVHWFSGDTGQRVAPTTDVRQLPQDSLLS